MTLSNIKWTASQLSSNECQSVTFPDQTERDTFMNNSLDLIQFRSCTYNMQTYLKIHQSSPLQIQRNWFITKYFGFHFHLIKYRNSKCIFCNTALLLQIRVGVLLSLCFYEQVTPVYGIYTADSKRVNDPLSNPNANI